MQLVLFVGTHIPSVHEHAAVLHVIKAHEQIDDGALATAGGADDAQAFAAPEGEVDVIEALFPFSAGQGMLRCLAVAEIDVLKANELVTGGGPGFLRGQNALVRLDLQHLGDAVGRRAGLADHDEDAVDAHHALQHHVEIRQKRKDHARLDLSAVHPCRPQPHYQRKADVEAHLHQRTGNGHDGAGLDIRPGHGLIAQAEAPLFIFGFGKRLDHTNAGNILTHHAHHIVQTLLHLAVKRNAISGNAQDDHDQNGNHHTQDGRERSVHHQRYTDAAQKHHRYAHAQGLQGLHAGLHVVAVAGHAADEAGQTEGVELRAGEVGRFGKQVLTDIVGHVMRVVNRHAVGPDIELAGDQCGGDHQKAPENHLPHLPQRHHLVDQVFQNIGNQQLRHRAQQLDRHGRGNSARISLHVAENHPHTGLPPCSRAFSAASLSSTLGKPARHSSRQRGSRTASRRASSSCSCAFRGSSSHS